MHPHGSSRATVVGGWEAVERARRCQSPSARSCPSINGRGLVQATRSSGRASPDHPSGNRGTASAPRASIRRLAGHPHELVDAQECPTGSSIVCLGRPTAFRIARHDRLVHAASAAPGGCLLVMATALCPVQRCRQPIGRARRSPACHRRLDRRVVPMGTRPCRGQFRCRERHVGRSRPTPPDTENRPRRGVAIVVHIDEREAAMVSTATPMRHVALGTPAASRPPRALQCDWRMDGSRAVHASDRPRHVPSSVPASSPSRAPTA